tara:strand:- start:969 stop:1235 length:267 start_codon:yes stop_codon:yes gene_type:complete
MTKNQILIKIKDNDMFYDNQAIIMVDGFEEAFVGITVTNPRRIIYDYWKCLDCIIRKEDLEFDDAIDFLEEFVEKDLGENTPLYIKQL